MLTMRVNADRAKRWITCLAVVVCMTMSAGVLHAQPDPYVTIKGAIMERQKGHIVVNEQVVLLPKKVNVIDGHEQTLSTDILKPGLRVIVSARRTTNGLVATVIHVPSPLPSDRSR
jgi:hypothetical protein